MTSLLRVRDVNFIKHETNEYVIILIYFSSQKKENKVLTFVIKELHLIDDLRVKMFIDNDILKLKKIDINIIKEIVNIDSCNVYIEVNVKQREDYIRKKVHVKELTTISTHS